MILTYGGDAIFGVPLGFSHTPNATAQQIATFFGVSGTQSIDGGTRGRAFLIKGLFFADAQAQLRGFEATLETYADGVARTLAVTYPDSSFYSYPYVTYRNEFRPSGPTGFDGGRGQYVMPYQMVLHGLF